MDDHFSTFHPAKDIYPKLCKAMICEVFLCMVLKHSASLPWTFAFLGTISNPNWKNLFRLTEKLILISYNECPIDVPFELPDTILPWGFLGALIALNEAKRRNITSLVLV